MPAMCCLVPSLTTPPSSLPLHASPRLCDPYCDENWRKWETYVRQAYGLRDNTVPYRQCVTPAMEFWALWVAHFYLIAETVPEVRLLVCSSSATNFRLF